MDTSRFLLSLVLCLLAATSSANGEVMKSDTEPTHCVLYQQLLNRVEKLELRDKEQKKEIDTLKTELNVEKQRTSVLEGIISALTGSGGEGHSDTRQTPNSANEAFPAYKRKTNSEPDTKPVRSARVKADHVPRVRRHGDTPNVAFYATLHEHVEHAGVNQTIIFENAVTNIGGGYNPRTGSFVAPVSGTYVFSATIMGSNESDTFNCFIMVNGVLAGKMYMRNDESPHGTDSITIVYPLDRGDGVVVQNVDSDRTIFGGDYSIFSGFLLHSEEPSLVITGK